jgi:hypothetical protein
MPCTSTPGFDRSRHTFACMYAIVCALLRKRHDQRKRERERDRERKKERASSAPLSSSSLTLFISLRYICPIFRPFCPTTPPPSLSRDFGRFGPVHHRRVDAHLDSVSHDMDIFLVQFLDEYESLLHTNPVVPAHSCGAWIDATTLPASPSLPTPDARSDHAGHAERPPRHVSGFERALRAMAEGCAANGLPHATTGGVAVYARFHSYMEAVGLRRGEPSLTETTVLSVLSDMAVKCQALRAGEV